MFIPVWLLVLAVVVVLVRPDPRVFWGEAKFMAGELFFWGLVLGFPILCVVVGVREAIK